MANWHLRDVSQANGDVLTYVEFNGSHDFIWQPYRLADGLKALTAL